MAALNERGLAVRNRHGYFMAQCPAHEDVEPSLSIRGVAGKVLLKCFPGCKTVDVAAALDLPLSALFDEEADRGKLARPVVIAEYEYTDEHGQLLFVQERRFPKDFRPKRPNGVGGWDYDLKGVRRVLYRLPAVLAAVAEGRTVWVCEGEKDVAAIERAGEVATCNPGGCGMGWHPSYGDVLKGADVVIVADRDNKGREHARRVLADLEGKAKSVVLVEAAEGKDATDHFAAGHTINDFQPFGEPTNSGAPQEAGPLEDWDDPIPLGALVELPAFPVDVFPGYIAATVRGVAAEVQVSEDLPGSLALAALSTAAGGRAEVLVRGQWREPLNVQTATAMPPGAGKSPAFRMMIAPVYAAEKALQELVREKIKIKEKERRQAIARAEEARRKAKSPDEIDTAVDAARMAEELEVPISPRLTADDVTPETAASILAEQGGRLAILSAEGTYLEVVLGRYSNKPNLELLLKGHAGDRLQVDRRGREEFVERPALTIGLCIQPQLLQDVAASKQMHGRGALARFLFSIPPDLVGHRNVYDPPLVAEDVLRSYTDTVKALIVTLSEWTDPAIIRLSPGALKAHTAWRAEIEPRLQRGTGDLESLREWASKLAGHTVRLAGLLHLAEHPQDGTRKDISADTMGRAITLARYYVAHAMAAFGVMRAHPLLEHARTVLAWIGNRDGFRLRDVHRGLQRRFSGAEEVAATLALLEDHGYVRRIDAASTGGRKPVVYAVNPKGR
ncbi:DUF3987 domain-containing protein [Nonomuraea lactucae]|uniref:DUF3987 domain-containing protein n=1 Tax=Nonomuraea lactucae TaxID=2249762 RepID=UPI0013B41D3E|nr:YfjI family protein [Nonomuraea lactucae]